MFRKRRYRISSTQTRFQLRTAYHGISNNSDSSTKEWILSKGEQNDGATGSDRGKLDKQVGVVIVINVRDPRRRTLLRKRETPISRRMPTSRGGLGTTRDGCSISALLGTAAVIESRD